MKKVIVYTDAHAPDHCRRSVNIAKQIIHDEKPDVLINLGDGGGFESLNHFNRYKLLIREGQRLVTDINTMFRLDAEIRAEAPKKCKAIRHIGNHEYWIQRLIMTHPELQGLHELDIPARYKELGWNVIPWGEFSKIGKLHFHHGDRIGYQGMWHSRAWTGTGRSVVYGHRHDIQRFTSELLTKDGNMIPNAGFSVGCLGLRIPQWMKNRRNNWSNGIAVIYFRSNGMFNCYLLDFIKGRCIWNGKEYQG